MTDQPVLQEELEVFRAEKARLLKDHAGKYALIKGSQLIGTYDTEENALTEGVARFGAGPFLIKIISEEEPKIDFPALTLGLISAQIRVADPEGDRWLLAAS